jgi:predicted sulfurtransferase
MGKILLFYKYVSVEYPKRILKWQQKICADLGLRGRILLAHEGINGTVGGDEAAIDRYIAIMRKHDLFNDIDFKVSDGEADYFPRMEIKVKNEIVHFGIDPAQLTVKDTGAHLTPEQVHQLMLEKPEDLVILDARNNFESRIGTFKDAITPDIEHFRQLPQFIDQNINLFKNKRVMMFCTGGIRCERATAYLNTKGVAKEVMQIEGGIVRYTEKYPDGFFRGKNYVFDRRVAVKINDDVLTHCDICNTSCDEYTNCLNAECNKKYVGCATCVTLLNNACSKQCQELVAAGKVKIRTLFVKAPLQEVVVRK